jgi:hypothetical protein
MLVEFPYIRNLGPSVPTIRLCFTLARVNLNRACQVDTESV